ncbi:MAG: hypothetical protein AB1758_35210, partial [Candidatus Eremiobacterota bacterium]
MEIRGLPPVTRPLASSGTVPSAPEFRKKRWMGLGWTGATREEAGRLLEQDRPVEVRYPGLDWRPVRDAAELEAVEVFYGSQPGDQLAVSMRRLLAAGGRFSTAAEGTLAGPDAHGRIGKGTVSLRVEDRHYLVRDAQDVHRAAFLESDGPPGPELHDPRRMENLRKILRSGCRVEDPLHPTGAATLNGVPVLALETALADPQLDLQLRQIERLQRDFGERAGAAHRILSGQESDRPFEERAALLLELADGWQGDLPAELYGSLVNRPERKSEACELLRLAQDQSAACALWLGLDTPSDRPLARLGQSLLQSMPDPEERRKLARAFQPQMGSPDPLPARLGRAFVATAEASLSWNTYTSAMQAGFDALPG